MASLDLQHPEYLWAVPLALTLVALWRIVRGRPYAAFPLAGLLKPPMYRASRLRRAPLVVAAAALPIVGVALADPVLPYSEAEMKSRGLDIVLVLDMSSSMEETMGAGTRRASGFTGQTRMETTKNALLEFIALRPDDRIGLVVFSDNAYVVSPLTFDHEYLRQYVAMIDNQILRHEGMTAIGDGIALAAALLDRQSTDDTTGNRVMVVFTDGEHNFGMDPVEAMDIAFDAGARVHIIGVDIPAEIKVRTEVRRLVGAVRRYGGRYFDADTVRQLRAASRAIDSLEKGWLVQRRYVRNEPVYHYFAVPAILLLTGAMLLRALPYFIDVT